MTRRLIVVGTGTGVGKTWVTASLAKLLGAEGQRVVALKPVETGVPDGASTGTDFARLAAASTERVRPQPFCFVPPVSPHLAARETGRVIELDSLLTYVQSHESCEGRAADWVLVETAGGLFSPLGPGLTNFELARALDPSSWLLVGPDSLGVLHDVTSTVGLARARGRAPDRVLLSAARAPDPSSGTNAPELATLGVAEPVFTAARDDASSLRALVDSLIR